MEMANSISIITDIKTRKPPITDGPKLPKRRPKEELGTLLFQMALWVVKE